MCAVQFSVVAVLHGCKASHDCLALLGTQYDGLSPILRCILPRQAVPSCGYVQLAFDYRMNNILALYASVEEEQARGRCGMLCNFFKQTTPFAQSYLPGLPLSEGKQHNLDVL
eukprot:scaffold14628_cov118-Isochrysis_galbana.AAC.6